MLNENRIHNQQHCLRGKEAGQNIMAKIVAETRRIKNNIYMAKISKKTLNATFSVGTNIFCFS